MEQNRNLEIKNSDRLPDRLFIIYKIEFYHCGASIKDAGRKGFMIATAEEMFIKGKIIEAINIE